MPFKHLRRALIAAVPGLLLVPVAAHAAVTISPLNGTPDAFPQTQISILGAAPSTIASVAVKGSRSGAHSGHLAPYSTGDGASFLLDKPLTQGERVSVAAVVGGHRATSSFTVARIGAVSPPPVPKTKPNFVLSALDSFKSAPNLLAPKVTVSKTTPAVANDGDLLLTPAPAPPVAPDQPPNPKAVPKIIGPGGPLIVDGQGNLVWFHLIQQTPGTAPIASADLKSLTFAGQPALAWWQGNINPLGFGQNGSEMVVDRNYKTLAAIKAGNGESIDLHDFIMAPNGDAFATVYQPVVADLSHEHGSKHAVILDADFQQIDVKTGLVKYEWHSWGHIAVGDSYNHAAAVGYDPWHLNSLQLVPHNRVVISERNTFAGYEIDLTTGRIIWTLGGKHSSFKMGRGAQFAFQHDIELQGSHTVTVFDDGAGPPVVNKESRGLQLTISTRHHSATAVHNFRRAQHTLAGSQGNMQTLGNGNKFVGFGAEPFFSEFSSTGTLLFDAALPAGDDSYRAYRVRWVGTPDPSVTPPALAGTGSGGNYTLYASWNGATEVASWQVIAGPSANALTAKVGAPVARSGFETTLPAQTNQPLVAVQALNSAGQVLGTSPATTP